MDTIWSIIGSAFGGFLGVIVFYLVKWKLEIIKAKPKLVAEYLCANFQNQGQESESEGDLMHHHGHRVHNIDELKKLGALYPVWEWTDEEVGRGKGFSIIYGPYTTDFDEPCIYSITFVIRGTGLKQLENKTDDQILLELDVNKSTPDYAMKPSGDFLNFNFQNKATLGYVRVSDLAEQGWVDCVLRFYSDAKGIWEYRILPYHGFANAYTKMREINPKARIFFDKIVIHKIPKIQTPSV